MDCGVAEYTTLPDYLIYHTGNAINILSKWVEIERSEFYRISELLPNGSEHMLTYLLFRIFRRI